MSQEQRKSQLAHRGVGFKNPPLSTSSRKCDYFASEYGPGGRLFADAFEVAQQASLAFTEAAEEPLTWRRESLTREVQELLVCWAISYDLKQSDFRFVYDGKVAYIYNRRRAALAVWMERSELRHRFLTLGPKNPTLEVRPRANSSPSSPAARRSLLDCFASENYVL